MGVKRKSVKNPKEDEVVENDATNSEGRKNPVKVSKKRKGDDISILNNNPKKQKMDKVTNDDDDDDRKERQIEVKKDKNVERFSNTKYLTCEDRNVKKDLAGKQERDKRCLVVKNLSADTTVEQLRGSSDDLLEVRVQVMKNKKAEGRKLAFLEFRDEESCRNNLGSARAFITEKQPEALVELAEKIQPPPSNLAFDPFKLFVSGFESNPQKSEIENFFPTCVAVEGVFEEEDGTQILADGHVVVSFSDAKECARVKDTQLKFKGRELIKEFMRAGKRQCRKAAKKIAKKATKKEKQQKSKDKKRANQNQPTAIKEKSVK